MLETMLLGNITFSTCIHSAQSISLLYPESFENEMFQLCLEYIKRHLINVDEANLTTTCVTLGKLIGKFYCVDIFKAESIKGTLSLLSKFEEVAYSNVIRNVILNSIFEKVMKDDDHVLKSIIPINFQPTACHGEIDDSDDSVTETETNEPAPKVMKEEKKPNPLVVRTNQPSVSVAILSYQTPMDRFKVRKCKF